MVNKRKIFVTVGVALVLGILAVLPFSALGQNVTAGYPPPAVGACYENAVEVAVFFGPTTAYGDASLTVPVLTIPGGQSGKSLQKYLVCSSDSTASAVQIVIGNNLAWVANPGSFQPRGVAD